MKTKRFISTIVAAIAACSLGLCLMACDGGGKDPSPTPTSAPTPTPTPAPDSVPALAPEKAVTVTDLFRSSGTYKDATGMTITYSYSLPKVDGPDTDYIYEINAAMAAAQKDYVDPSLSAMQRGESIGWGHVEYTAGKAGDITTIMLVRSNAYDNLPLYDTWIIGIDGRQAETTELFAAKQVTADQVLAKIREMLSEYTSNDYDAIEKALGKEFADETRACDEKTLSDENINTHMPYFINEDGHLCVVATTYVVAGAGFKVRVLDLGF